MTSDETADAPEKKSRVELRRTPAEILADSILRQQRIKGRKTYGQGLKSEDPYEWLMEAAQEFADGYAYSCAEIRRVYAENVQLRGEVARLTAELDSLRKATLDTAPFLPPAGPPPGIDLKPEFAILQKYTPPPEHADGQTLGPDE